jgi:hypothetical protein
MQAGGQRPNMQQVQAMQKAMPPELLRQMRSAGSPQAAQKVMQEYIAKNGEGGIDMQSMMNAMMPGMGGMMGGGMPGMPGGFARWTTIYLRKLTTSPGRYGKFDEHDGRRGWRRHA